MGQINPKMRWLAARVVYFHQMRWLFLVFLFGLCLSIIIYPASVLHPANSLPDDNDTRLLTYIINQVQNNLLESRPLFYGHFFAPYENTLTYSDPFVTTAVLVLPFRQITNNPVVIFNLAYLINGTLTFATSFLFFSYLIGSKKRGLFASLLFYLSGYHLIYLPHLQVFSLWATFLALYFFLRFHKEEKVIYLNLFYLSTFIQLTDSLFPVFLIFFASFFFFLNKPQQFKTIILNGLPFLLSVFVFLLPHLKMTLNFPEAPRPIRDAAHFSLGLEEIFTKYRSWTVITLLTLSLLRGRTPNLIKRSDLLILASGLILSFGPVVKLLGHTVKIFGLPIPLPYTLFYYLFPGFQGFRTPSRFILLALIGAAAVIASRFPKKSILVLLTLPLLILEARLPKPGFFVDPTPPPIYDEVKKLPPGSVILELPIYLWNSPGHELESVRSIYSLYHDKRRLGGYSGFAPQTWINLVQLLNQDGLRGENKARLPALGITHVVENSQLKPLQ